MAYYYEKTGSYLSTVQVRRQFGDQMLSYSSERQKEYGLCPAYYLEYTYNPYSHTVDSIGTVSWTEYDNDSDLLAANPSADLDGGGYNYPAYFGSRSIIEVTGADRDDMVNNAKTKVFNEVADRMAKVAGASLALRINALSLSDSASDLSGFFASSDSDILDLAYDLDQGDSVWNAFDTTYIGSTSVVSDITAGQNLNFSGLPTSDPGVAGQLWRDSDVVKVSL